MTTIARLLLPFGENVIKWFSNHKRNITYKFVPIHWKLKYGSRRIEIFYNFIFILNTLGDENELKYLTVNHNK